MSRESATTGFQGVEEWRKMPLASWPTGLGACWEQKVENVRNLVETAVVLHNLLRQRVVMAANEVDHEDEEHNFVPGAWRHGPHWEDVQQPHARGNLATVDARHQRDHLRDYFVSPVGAVDWQQRMAGVVLPAAVEERNGSEADDEDED